MAQYPLIPPTSPQALTTPLEVDLLLIGFQGDGAYGYSFSYTQLEEVWDGVHLHATTG